MPVKIERQTTYADESHVSSHIDGQKVSRSIGTSVIVCDHAEITEVEIAIAGRSTALLITLPELKALTTLLASVYQSAHEEEEDARNF